jgi:hypothetical protein
MKNEEENTLIGMQNRGIGFLFLLSPLGNLFLTAWQQPSGSLSTLKNILQISSKITPVSWLLFVLNLSAGITLIVAGNRQSRLAERIAILALGLNLIQNLVTLSQDLKAHKYQAIIPILINIALFAWFYLDGSARLSRLTRFPDLGSVGDKVKVLGESLGKSLTRPTPSPLILPLNPGVPVQLDSQAPWATIVEISETELRIRPNGKEAVPPQAESKTVEFTFDADFTVRARFDRKEGADYLFRYVGERPVPRQTLEGWSRRVRRKKTG